MIEARLEGEVVAAHSDFTVFVNTEYKNNIQMLAFKGEIYKGYCPSLDEVILDVRF